MKLKSQIFRRYHTGTNTSQGLLLVSERTGIQIEDDCEYKCEKGFGSLQKVIIIFDIGTSETELNLLLTCNILKVGGQNSPHTSELVRLSRYTFQHQLTHPLQNIYHNLIIFNTTLSIKSSITTSSTCFQPPHSSIIEKLYGGVQSKASLNQQSIIRMSKVTESGGLGGFSTKHAPSFHHHVVFSQHSSIVENVPGYQIRGAGRVQPKACTISTLCSSSM